MCGSFLFYYRALNDLKLDWRLSHEKPGGDCDEEELDPAYRESVKCKIFLGFTSNLVSSGIRDIIRFLVQHRMVSDPPSSIFFVRAGEIELFFLFVFIQWKQLVG